MKIALNCAYLSLSTIGSLLNTFKIKLYWNCHMLSALFKVIRTIGSVGLNFKLWELTNVVIHPQQYLKPLAHTIYKERNTLQ